MQNSEAMPAVGMLAFALSYCVLALSPGPNFLVVAQSGLAGSRVAAFWTALGVSAGAGLLTLASTLLTARLIAGSLTSLALSLCCAAVLLVMGCRVIFNASSGCSELVSRSYSRASGAFLLGFATALFNPATIAFLGASAPSSTPAAMEIMARTGIVFGIAAVWFVIAGQCIALQPAQSIYRRNARLFSTSAGIVLVAFALLAILRAVQ